MSLLKKIFSFAGHDINILSFVDKHGETWMLANPFAEILGYKKPHSAVSSRVSGNNQNEYWFIKKGKDFDQGDPAMKIHPNSKFINKQGLYELIMKSRLPNAVEFQMWVMEEVLPQLDKKGAYFMKEAPPLQQAQMNIVHKIVEGEDATWCTEKIHLLEKNNALMERNDELSRNLISQMEKVLALQPLIVKVPRDDRQFHHLEIYKMPWDIEGYHCYQGVRAQRKSINKLRPKGGELVAAFKTPNAINSFNKIKENIDCLAKHNRIICRLDTNDFIDVINNS